MPNRHLLLSLQPLRREPHHQSRRPRPRRAVKLLSRSHFLRSCSLIHRMSSRSSSCSAHCLLADTTGLADKNCEIDAIRVDGDGAGKPAGYQRAMSGVTSVSSPRVRTLKSILRISICDSRGIKGPSAPKAWAKTLLMDLLSVKVTTE